MELATMDLIGYADRLSVAPGERLRFMVSAQVPSYEAHIVRLARATPPPDAAGLMGEIEQVRAAVPLRARQWYAVACTYDAATGQVRLWQELVVRRPVDDARVTAAGAVGGQGGAPAGPLLLGAQRYVAGPGHPYAEGCFNGKIDRPCLFSRALSAAEVEALPAGASPAAVGGKAVVAAWDCGREMAAARVHDTSLSGLHGRAVNTPMPAVTGHKLTVAA